MKIWFFDFEFVIFDKQWRPQKKNIGGAKCDVVIYDVTNQIFECDADKPTDIATSEWLVCAYLDA